LRGEGGRPVRRPDRHRRLTALPAAVALLGVFAISAAKPSPAPAARAHHPAPPRVQVMIVGRDGVVLSAARAIVAAPGTVHVAGRSCSVAAGTPLAVLVALRRAGGPSFALRDYGHCDGSPKDSAELFVKGLGGQPNAGRSGWEYKVEGAAGSTGAADPSGPMGDGRRLRNGAQLLWFYCETTPAGCQRTLAVSPRAISAAPASSLQLTVGSYDDEGTLAPEMGASVTIDSLMAISGAGGKLTLSAPLAPGSYELTATQQGFVPSFPVLVTVR